MPVFISNKEVPVFACSVRLQFPMRGNGLPNIRKELLPWEKYPSRRVFIFKQPNTTKWLWQSPDGKVRFQISGKAMYFQALRFKIYCRGKKYPSRQVFMFCAGLASQKGKWSKSRDSKKYLRQWQFVSKVQLTFYCRGVLFI